MFLHWIIEVAEGRLLSLPPTGTTTNRRALLTTLLHTRLWRHCYTRIDLSNKRCTIDSPHRDSHRSVGSKGCSLFLNHCSYNAVCLVSVVTYMCNVVWRKAQIRKWWYPKFHLEKYSSKLFTQFKVQWWASVKNAINRSLYKTGTHGDAVCWSTALEAGSIPDGTIG